MKTAIRSMQFNLYIALWRKYDVAIEINEQIDDSTIMYVRWAIMEDVGGSPYR